LLRSFPDCTATEIAANLVVEGRPTTMSMILITAVLAKSAKAMAFALGAVAIMGVIAYFDVNS